MMIHRRLAALAWTAPGLFVATVLLGLAASAAAVGQGFLTGRAIAAVVAGDGARDLLWLLLGVTGLIVGRGGLLWGQSAVGQVMGGTVKLRLRRRLYGRLLDLGPGYSVNLKGGEVQATLADGLEHLDPYVSRYLPQALIAVIVPLAVVAYLFTLDSYVGAIVLLSALLIAWGPRVWKTTLGRAGERHWATWTAVSSRFVEGLLGMVTLKAFNASRRFGRELRNEAVRLYLATRHLLLVSLASTFLIGLTHTGGLALAAIVGTFRFVNGDLTAVELLVILFLVNEAYRPLTELANYWHQGYLGVSASAGIFALVDAPPVLAAGEGRPLPPRPADRPPTIRFERVSFTYPGASRPALRDFDLTLSPGRTVALVGRSGSGKTTALSLLLRSFDPTSGRVTVDGEDIRSVDLGDYRRLFAVVSQDVFLFHGTIADNLRLADPDADDERLVAAARAAGIHPFIASLPEGYGTMVGERGVRLSGGERQRVAIARAFLKDAPVLILDEPTSSLDGESERHIRHALDQLMRDRATLVISHRLSAVDFANTVVMLDDGATVEAGPPRQLLAAEGRFAELVRAQAEAMPA